MGDGGYVVVTVVGGDSVAEVLQVLAAQPEATGVELHLDRAVGPDLLETISREVEDRGLGMRIRQTEF